MDGGSEAVSDGDLRAKRSLGNRPPTLTTSAFAGSLHSAGPFPIGYNLGDSGLVEMPTTIRWADLEPIAAEAFRIWTGSPELRWAKQAWSHLTRAGLAKNREPLDGLRAYIRFLVLASIYRDWCAVAFDYSEDDEPTLWLSAVHVDPVDIELLLGPDIEVRACRPFEPRLDNALNTLMERERESVLDALLKGFGSVEDLFIALWRSNQDPVDWADVGEGDGVTEALETDDHVLNELTIEKLAGYSWISEGCEFRGPVRCRTD